MSSDSSSAKSAPSTSIEKSSVNDLHPEIDLERVPRHVAIIMDGNGRWAVSRGLERNAGHREGIESVREIIRACRDYGVECLTLYAFSIENWNRPKGEVSELMRLLEEYLETELAEVMEHRAQVRSIGRLDRLPPSTRRAALEARSNGSLSAAQAAPRSLLAARARGLGSSPHATRHASHAIRDAGLRDAIYKFVARHRIWFFGAVETCRRATKEDKKHFL